MNYKVLARYAVAFIIGLAILGPIGAVAACLLLYLMTPSESPKKS